MKQGKGLLCQENTLVIANTLFQQHKRRLYTWTSPDGRHRNQIDYILCSQRWRSSIQSAKTRPGADCGSDHELLIVKFRLKLKKVEKTTIPFRYDLNQIPYDYDNPICKTEKETQVLNRLLDSVGESEGGMFQENSIKTCILSRVEQITSPGWMHETSVRTWCTGKTQRDRAEREVGVGIGMGNACKSMADSCQCMAKSTTIL